MEMLWIVVLLLLGGGTAGQTDLGDEAAEALEGGAAYLPCSMNPLVPPDKVTKVAWYREDDESPMYTYDLRGGAAKHWAEKTMGDRAFLRVLDEERAVLTVSPIRLTDEATYHCQVDFVRSPSRHSHVNLTVVVPAQGVQVMDDTGFPLKTEKSMAYAEGASATFTCIASGGKPLARVSWWRSGELVTDDTQHFPDKAKSQSILRIQRLTRSHLAAIYSCEVSNSRLQPPLVVRVSVDMFLRPLETRLMGNNTPLSAGRKHEITCRSKGSRPAATITWWKDGLPLEGGAVTVSADGNTTSSVLTIVPTASDHNLLLSCRASNPLVPLSELRDTWMLHVLYAPKVTLTLGNGLNANEIREGADVYFECHIVANPWVLRVWWLRDGQRLLSNASAGIIVSNQTLVLQGVNRGSSGRYCCEATNTEGLTRSSPFQMRVKFEPVCAEGGGRKVLGAAKQEPLRVECKVDAEPPATLFRWSFNSTPGSVKELTDFNASPGQSLLTYTPEQAADYGTLHCWGRNELGSQRSPCVYHVVPAGLPDTPTHCLQSNVTHHSLTVTCHRGFDGGLRQRFALTVMAGENVVANISASTVPEFTITGLEPAQEYTLITYAINGKGWSKGTTPLIVKTLPAPGLKEQRRSTGPASASTERIDGAWFYILWAGTATLLIAATVAAGVFVSRRFRVESPVHDIRPPRSPKREAIPMVSTASDTGAAYYNDSSSNDEKNPDLIPPTNENFDDAPYTITARPSSKRNSATQMPVKPYHVTWAPILQSRNCATQTPPPHKESSV